MWEGEGKYGHRSFLLWSAETQFELSRNGLKTLPQNNLIKPLASLIFWRTHSLLQCTYSLSDLGPSDSQALKLFPAFFHFHLSRIYSVSFANTLKQRFVSFPNFVHHAFAYTIFGTRWRHFQLFYECVMLAASLATSELLKPEKDELEQDPNPKSYESRTMFPKNWTIWKVNWREAALWALYVCQYMGATYPWDLYWLK